MHATGENECMVCAEEFQLRNGIQCEQGHFVCSGCFQQYAKSELEKINADTNALEKHRKRDGNLLCPARPKCNQVHRSYIISKHVDQDTFQQYENAREEVLKYQEFAKMNVEMKEMERVHQEERKWLESRLKKEREKVQVDEEESLLLNCKDKKRS